MANDALKIIDRYPTAFKKIIWIAATAIVCSFIFAIYCQVSSRKAVAEARANIYILDEGSVLEASRADNNAQRDLEAVNHVTRFHELFFNIAPFAETIENSINMALELADKSAYDYYNTLDEQRFFEKMHNDHATQSVIVDSIQVNMNVYPYQVHTWCRRYYTRISNMTKYAMETSCQLKEVPRSRKNPHGLMIERFVVLSDRDMGTRITN